MNVDDELVFQTALFSNWELFWNLVFWVVGIRVTFWHFVPPSSDQRKNHLIKTFRAVWSFFWLSFTAIWLITILWTAFRYHNALQNGNCQMVSGRVTVLREQPWTGHSPGDLVRIGETEFEIDYYHSTLAYNRTIAHGGVLSEGAQVRVCHLKGEILRVEVQQ